jgi:hypothetical protein
MPLTKAQQEWIEKFDELFNSLGLDHVTGCGCLEDDCSCLSSREKLKKHLTQAMQAVRKKTIEECIERVGSMNDGCGCCSSETAEENLRSLLTQRFMGMEIKTDPTLKEGQWELRTNNKE